MHPQTAGPVILERRTVHRGYVSVDVIKIRLSDDAVVVREVEGHGDAVAVLPYDPQRRCALIVSLFRAPVFVTTHAAALEEACAGMVDATDSDAAAAGRREAYEELGVQLAHLELIARVWSTPGVSTERVSLFTAPYNAGDRSGSGGGVPGEQEGITVIERPLLDLAGAADRGHIVDGKLLTLILALRSRQPQLF